MEWMKIKPRATLVTVVVIALALTVLKLFGHIDWSWWHVTFPLWGCYLVVTVWLIVILIRARR
jgi:uncharacterized membrane protein